MSTAVAISPRERLNVFAGPAASWACAILMVVVWQVWASLSASMYFPKPTAIFQNIVDLWFSAGLTNGLVTEAFEQDVLPSLARLFISLALAWVLGISIGTLLGSMPRVAPFIEPILHFMRGLPGPVLLPLALVLIGTGDDMRIALITFGAIWPILFNTYSAVKQVPESFIENARVAQRSKVSLLFQVILPASSAGILAGMRVSGGLGVVLLVASELVAASNGIGFGLTQSQRVFNFIDMWSFIVALSVLGYLLNLVLSGFERLFMGWHRQLKALDD